MDLKLVRKVPFTKKRRHVMTLSATAPSDEKIVSVGEFPQILFRVDRVVLWDSAKREGHGTEVQAFVGNKFALGQPEIFVSSSAFLRETPGDLVRAILRAREAGLHDVAKKIQEDFLGGKSISEIDLLDTQEIQFPTCDHCLRISFNVRFLEKCDWRATLYGWAID